MIFINLPITDTQRSRKFYEVALGCEILPEFSSSDTLCAKRDESTFFMLLERARFAEFSPHPLGDPATSTCVLLALRLSSRAEVDDTFALALKSGGSDAGKTQDFGDQMYSRSVHDPDGTVFELFFMKAD